MAPNVKPAPRNWNDVQIFLAASAMAFTLALWNVFAGPDRALAAEKPAEAALQPPTVDEPAAIEAATPPAIQQGKILLGGQAPQTEIFVTNVRGGDGGAASLPVSGGGGGGGGGGTGSS